MVRSATPLATKIGESQVTGVSDPEMTRAFDERAEVMRRRARELAVHALEQGQVWVSGLGFRLVTMPSASSGLMPSRSSPTTGDRLNIGNDPWPLGPCGAEPLQALSHRKEPKLPSNGLLVVEE